MGIGSIWKSLLSVVEGVYKIASRLLGIIRAVGDEDPQIAEIVELADSLKEYGEEGAARVIIAKRDFIISLRNWCLKSVSANNATIDYLDTMLEAVALKQGEIEARVELDTEGLEIIAAAQIAGRAWAALAQAAPEAEIAAKGFLEKSPEEKIAWEAYKKARADKEMHRHLS